MMNEQNANCFDECEFSNHNPGLEVLKVNLLVEADMQNCYME